MIAAREHAEFYRSAFGLQFLIECLRLSYRYRTIGGTVFDQQRHLDQVRPVGSRTGGKGCASTPPCAGILQPSCEKPGLGKGSQLGAVKLARTPPTATVIDHRWIFARAAGFGKVAVNL